MSNIIYTIGYCCYSIADFISELKKYDIKCIVDTRAIPKSGTFPVYDEPELAPVLKNAGIYYLSMANELGARPKNQALYTVGKVDFDKLAAAQFFQAALRRLKSGVDKFNICLMCAQKDPIICHRALLITHNFRKYYPEIEIMHLQPGLMESQASLDSRAIKKAGLDQGNLFLDNNADMILNRAYQQLGKGIAWENK